jgi:hypothetical protein
LKKKEWVVENCYQCPFLQDSEKGDGSGSYCFLERSINLDDYYPKRHGEIKFGFPDECPLFENDQIIVKRVRLRLFDSDIAKWEVKENATCADCGRNARGYRLVYAKDYDKINDEHPEFRCERCSIQKAQKLKERGLEI